MTAAMPSMAAAVPGRGSPRAAALGRLLVAPPILLAGLAALIPWVPGATDGLELDRGALAAGEAWRLLTGHWTHWNLGHLAWDVAAFAALGTQCWLASRGLFWRCLVGSMLAVSVLVLACQPEIQSYRGLSGIDAAFFAAVTVDTLHRARRMGSVGPQLGVVLVGAMFAVKLIYEFTTQTAFFVDLGPGVVPLPLAHLVGAAVGGWQASKLAKRGIPLPELPISYRLRR